MAVRGESPSPARRPPRLGKITGIAKSADGRPVAECHVTAEATTHADPSPTEDVAITNAEGRYSQGCPAATYTVRARCETPDGTYLRAMVVGLVVQAGQTVNLDITVTEDPQLADTGTSATAPPPHALPFRETPVAWQGVRGGGRGTGETLPWGEAVGMVRMSDGRPAAGLTIRHEPELSLAYRLPWEETRTASNGQYRLNLLPGTYTVIAEGETPSGTHLYGEATNVVVHARAMVLADVAVAPQPG